MIPKVQRLQKVMNQAKAGAAVWKAMEQSERKIFIQFHNSKAKGDVVGSQLKNEGSKAQTMTLDDYNQRKEGIVEDHTDKLKNQVHFLKTEGDPGKQIETKDYDNFLYRNGE